MRRFPKSVIWFAGLMFTAANVVAQSNHPASTENVVGNQGAAVNAASSARVIKPSPPDPQIVQAMENVSAAELRASVEKLASFGTRLTLTADVPASSGKGIAASRDWIKAAFERYSKACGGCLEVKTDTFTVEKTERIPQRTEITNVYAVLRGSDPENAKRVVLVSGHYDSRASDVLDKDALAPGANDDGSGTAVALEAARVLSKYKFPATIIFLAVAGEEQGLNGSRHFAKMAKEQGWVIEAVLNDDTVGGDKSPGQKPWLRVFSEGLPIAGTLEEWRRIRMLGTENDSPSRQLARFITEVAAQYGKDVVEPKMIFRQDRFLRGGDHTAFNEQGFAAVRLTEWRENYDRQHQNVRTENGIEYGDLPKFVDFDYLANVARLNTATLASLAVAPAPPAQVRILTKNLENDTTLSWQASPGGLATGYEVLWRPTTSATWEFVKSVGNVTEATLPESKDNVIFAVRAVDAKGHRSLAVVPVPER